MRKKCSIDQEHLLKFEAEGQEFANSFRIIEKFIQTVMGQNNFWQQNAFLTYSWRFLRSKKLEKLEFKLVKNYWDLKICRKSYEIIVISKIHF